MLYPQATLLYGKVPALHLNGLSGNAPKIFPGIRYREIPKTSDLHPIQNREPDAAGEL
jgi:hypothetical protein